VEGLRERGGVESVQFLPEAFDFLFEDEILFREDCHLLQFLFEFLVLLGQRLDALIQGFYLGGVLLCRFRLLLLRFSLCRCDITRGLIVLSSR